MDRLTGLSGRVAEVQKKGLQQCHIPSILT